MRALTARMIIKRIPDDLFALEIRSEYVKNNMTRFLKIIHAARNF